MQAHESILSCRMSGEFPGLHGERCLTAAHFCAERVSGASALGISVVTVEADLTHVPIPAGPSAYQQVLTEKCFGIFHSCLHVMDLAIRALVGLLGKDQCLLFEMPFHGLAGRPFSSLLQVYQTAIRYYAFGTPSIKLTVLYHKHQNNN